MCFGLWFWLATRMSSLNCFLLNCLKAKNPKNPTKIHPTPRNWSHATCFTLLDFYYVVTFKNQNLVLKAVRYPLGSEGTGQREGKSQILSSIYSLAILNPVSHKLFQWSTFSFCILIQGLMPKIYIITSINWLHLSFPVSQHSLNSLSIYLAKKANIVQGGKKK